MTHGNDPKFLSCHQKEGDKKKLRVVAVTHGDDPNFLSCHQKKGDKGKVEGCRRDSWRQPSILFFWSIPLKLIKNFNIAGFLAKTEKKMPIKKKIRL